MKNVKIHFFKDCTTVEEVKELYKKLAKEHHPDKGGNVETMQALNNEYTFVCAKIVQGAGMTAEETEASILSAEAYRDAINAIIHLDGLIIELIGAWIWVSGDTYKHKIALKAAKYEWKHKKEMWVFRTAEYKTRNRTPMHIDEIRAKYGSERINGKGGSYLKAS